MHDHDDLLIAALAAGDLRPKELTAARTEIEGCSRCRSELEEQMRVRTLLAKAAAPTLSDLERARLHHAVDRAAREQARRWYIRLAPALAVTAGLVIVAGVGIGVLRPGDGAELAAPEASTAAETRQAEPPSAESQVEPMTEATGAPAAPLPTETDFGSITRSELRSILESVAADTEDAAAEDDGGGSPCEDVANREGGTRVGTAQLEGRELEIYRLRDGGALALELPECDLADRVVSD